MSRRYIVLIGMKAPQAEALRSQAAAREASERATNAGSIALNPIE